MAGFATTAAVVVAAVAGGVAVTNSGVGGSTRSIGGGGGGGSTTTNYTLEGTVDWDLDLWGRIRRQVESNAAAAEVSAADLANARLSVQVAIATDYFQLRGADTLQRLLDETVAAFERSLQIAQNQYKVGIAARSDVITAQSQLETTRAQAINVGVARAQFEHAIAVLIGHPPAELTSGRPARRPGARAAARPALGPARAPARHRRRGAHDGRDERADRRADRGLLSGRHPVGAVRIRRQPGGLADPTANRVWSLGASASQTLFEGGARSGCGRGRPGGLRPERRHLPPDRAHRLPAGGGQLSTLRILQQQAVVQEQAVLLARQAVQISLNEYRAGTVAYNTVVTSQAAALSDEQTALSLQAQRLQASATLIGALGGGWTTAELPIS